MDEIYIKRDKSVKHFEKSESFTKKKGEKIMTKRFGFTLAEVLITLGIIGVVAAMTMPTLMNSTQGAQYKAAYKKALSAISQGVTLNVALDGSSFADTVAGTAGSTTKPATGDSTASVLNSRMNVVRATAGNADGYTITGMTKSADNTALFFNDGVVFSFVTADNACTANADGALAAAKICKGYIDVNGQKGPNKVVACDNGTDNEASCKVSSPTDVYPVRYYDQTILPNSRAARAVLYGK